MARINQYIASEADVEFLSEAFQLPADASNPLQEGELSRKEIIDLFDQNKDGKIQFQEISNTRIQMGPDVFGKASDILKKYGFNVFRECENVEASYDLNQDHGVDNQDYELYADNAENPMCYTDWYQTAQKDLHSAGSKLEIRTRRPEGAEDFCEVKPKVLSREAKQVLHLFRTAFNFKAQNAAQIFNPTGNRIVDQYDFDHHLQNSHIQIDMKDYRALAQGFLDLAQYYKSNMHWSLPEVADALITPSEVERSLQINPTWASSTSTRDPILRKYKQDIRDIISNHQDNLMISEVTKAFIDIYAAEEGMPETPQEFVDIFLTEFGKEYLAARGKYEDEQKKAGLPTRSIWDDGLSDAQIRKNFMTNSLTSLIRELYGVYCWEKNIDNPSNTMSFDEFEAKIRSENGKWFATLIK